MKKEVIKRVEEVSEYILNTRNTIRETAKQFKVSKSTIHKDINERLRDIDLKKYNKIAEIFNEHIKIRHIIGGQSTKLKYQQMKLNNEG